MAWTTLCGPRSHAARNRHSASAFSDGRGIPGAGRVIALLSDYVLCQRVKPPVGAANEPQYAALLVVSHAPPDFVRCSFTLA